MSPDAEIYRYYDLDWQVTIPNMDPHIRSFEVLRQPDLKHDFLIIRAFPKIVEGALEAIKYPTETLHEIIANAVLHRDYSVADDVHI